MQSLDQLIARFENQWKRFERYTAALKVSGLPAAEQNMRQERALCALEAAATKVAAFHATSLGDMIQKARIAVRMGSALECDKEITASIVRDLIEIGGSRQTRAA